MKSRGRGRARGGEGPRPAATPGRGARVAPPGAGDARARLAIAAPALIAAALYAPALRFAFVWDDVHLIPRDEALRRWAPGAWLASDYWRASGGHTGMWRPLVTLSFALDGALSGFRPWLFHATNLVAHALAAALVAALALALTRSRLAGLLAGAWFACAPSHVEAVAWIAGRTDTLAALFSLGALALETRGGRRARALAWGCAAAAMLSKETAYVLALPVLALARARRLPWREAALRTAPYAALALVLGALHARWAGAPLAPTLPAGALAHDRAGAAALLLAHFAYLAPFVPHSPLLSWGAPAAPLAGAAWAGLALLAALGGFALARGARVAVPLALALAPLAPVAAAVFVEGGGRLAERSLMLPSAGVALLLALGIAAVTRAPLRRGAAAVVGALAVLGAGETAYGLPAWRNDETRIARIAVASPGDPDAPLGLAELLGEQGRYAEAEAQIAEADRRAPGSAEVSTARAVLRYREGRYDQALAEATAALGRDPGYYGGQLLRVKALTRLGRAREAVAAAETLLAWPGRRLGADAAAGEAWLAAGDESRAEAALRRARLSETGDPELECSLGIALARRGDLASARASFERATALAPGYYEAWLLLAGTCARLGDARSASAALASAARLPQAADGRVEAFRRELGLAP